MLILEPCCLLGMWHQGQQESFPVANYSFPTKEVCGRPTTKPRDDGRDILDIIWKIGFTNGVITCLGE